MKKYLGIVFALVLLLSLSVVTAVPAAAQESISITGDPEATITRTDTLDEVTFDIEILSDNPSHGVYGVGLAFATSLDQPAFQVWHTGATGQPGNMWNYQEYSTGWGGEVTPLAEKTGFSATGTETEKNFSVTIPTAELGGFGATYYYAVQVRTSDIDSYPDGWSWDSPVSDYAVVKLLVLNEDTGMLYGTIQAAINAASGTTLVCAPGTYEERITIDKANLTLESAVPHGATIDGGTKAAISIKAEGVTVDGFEILSSYVSAVYAYEGSHNVKVLNNAVAGGGIYIDFSQGVEILGNRITNAPHMAIFPFGDKDINISNNIVTDSANGILIHQADGATVEYNTVSGSSGDAAMQIVGSKNVVIEFNNITDNDAVGIQHGTDWWSGPITPENNMAHYNNIVGNELGVQNWDEAKAFDATNNWWGTSDETLIAGMVEGAVDWSSPLDSSIEPGTGAVSMTAASEKAIIGILVSPTFINFGTITSGAVVSGSALTVQNFGNVPIIVEAEITADTAYNDVGDLFYTAALRLNGSPSSFGSWAHSDFLVDGSIEVKASRSVLTELHCPSPVMADTTYTGTVVFWAEQPE